MLLWHPKGFSSCQCLVFIAFIRNSSQNNSTVVRRSIRIEATTSKQNDHDEGVLRCGRGLPRMQLPAASASTRHIRAAIIFVIMEGRCKQINEIMKLRQILILLARKPLYLSKSYNCYISCAVFHSAEVAGLSFLDGFCFIIRQPNSFCFCAFRVSIAEYTSRISK